MLPLYYYLLCSVTKSYLTLCNPLRNSLAGSSVLLCLPEFAQIHVHWVVMLSNHLILCHPLLLFPSVFQHQAFELALHIWWPKYWSFCFSISPSNEYSELISFRIDWFDLLIVQGTLKSLLQPNSKASILWRSAFFMVQLSHPDMTTGKTRTLTIWTFVSNSRGNAFKHIQWGQHLSWYQNQRHYHPPPPQKNAQYHWWTCSQKSSTKH